LFLCFFAENEAVAGHKADSIREIVEQVLAKTPEVAFRAITKNGINNIRNWAEVIS